VEGSNPFARSRKFLKYQRFDYQIDSCIRQGPREGSANPLRPSCPMEIERSFLTSEPLSQGDLIALSNFENRHPLDRFGVIITADCDIERARPDHLVTFLRIAPVFDYICHVWSRKKIHILLKQMTITAAAMFDRLSRAVDTDRSPIS